MKAESKARTSILATVEALEATNFANAVQHLRKHGPDGLLAVELYVDFLAHARHQFGSTCGYADAEALVEGWIEQAGCDREELFELLESGAPSSAPPIVRDSYLLTRALQARTALLLRLQRDFLLGILSLLRLQVTASVGCLRLEVESIALLALFGDKPELGVHWWKAFDPAAGKVFHKTYHHQVVERMKTLLLHDLYEEVSAAAAHSRPGGVAASLVVPDDDADFAGLTFSYNEIAGARQLYMSLVMFLRRHKRVGEALVRVLGGPLLTEPLAKFGDALGRFEGSASPIIGSSRVAPADQA